MKVMMLPIQVYAIWDEDGTLHPLAFCFVRNDEKVKVSVTSQGCQEEHTMGHRMLNFYCRSEYRGESRMVYLRYDEKNRRWYLYKI